MEPSRLQPSGRLLCLLDEAEIVTRGMVVGQEILDRDLLFGERAKRARSSSSRNNLSVCNRDSVKRLDRFLMKFRTNFRDLYLLKMAAIFPTFFFLS